MHLVNSKSAILVLVIFAALTALIVLGQVRRRRLVRSIFSDNQRDLLLANYSPAMRAIRLTALALALFLVSFALLDPRWGTKSTEKEMDGIDVVLLMDISASMDTPDVAPSRLGYAQKLSQQLLSLLIGNRIGLAAFAGFGFKVIPLTMDLDAATIFLNELSTGMIDEQGTNLEDALKQAIELFQKDTLTHKVIVMMTDGEDSETDPMSQVKIAKENGITIFTVGIGTPAGGEIPILDEHGNPAGFLEDRGQKVVSKLNEALLTRIAAETGGAYYAGSEDSIIKLAQQLDQIKKSRFGTNMYEFMEPQYQYFLLMALLLLFVFMFLPDRRVRVPSAVSKGAGAVMVLAALFLPATMHASDASEGVLAYRRSDFKTAVEDFRKAILRRPNDQRLRYNEAGSYYGSQDYRHAVEDFSALIGSRRDDLRERSLFNLGNSFYKMQNLPAALNAYRQVIDSADPSSFLYQKAVNNYMLAKQQLQQQQQNQNQTNQNQQQQQQNQNQTNQNQQQQQQNQTNQNQQQQQSQSQTNRQAQPQPVSPSDVESLLNLIAEEEKQHLSEEQRRQGLMIVPRHRW